MTRSGRRFPQAVPHRGRDAPGTAARSGRWPMAVAMPGSRRRRRQRGAGPSVVASRAGAQVGRARPGSQGGRLPGGATGPARSPGRTEAEGRCRRRAAGARATPPRDRMAPREPAAVAAPVAAPVAAAEVGSLGRRSDPRCVLHTTPAARCGLGKEMQAGTSGSAPPVMVAGFGSLGPVRSGPARRRVLTASASGGRGIRRIDRFPAPPRGKGGGDEGRGHAPPAVAGMGKGIAPETDAAALPGGAGHLRDGGPHAREGVREHRLDPPQAAPASACAGPRSGAGSGPRMWRFPGPEPRACRRCSRRRRRSRRPGRPARRAGPRGRWRRSTDKPWSAIGRRTMASARRLPAGGSGTTSPCRRSRRRAARPGLSGSPTCRQPRQHAGHRAGRRAARRAGPRACHPPRRPAKLRCDGGHFVGSEPAGRRVAAAKHSLGQHRGPVPAVQDRQTNHGRPEPCAAAAPPARCLRPVRGLDPAAVRRYAVQPQE